MSRIWIAIAFVLIMGLKAAILEELSCKPFGLRLNLGLNFYNQTEKQMLGIRFNTNKECSKSYVIFQKPYSTIFKTQCKTDSFQLGAYTGYIHKCSISNLTYGDSFSYMAYGWEGPGSDQPIPFENNFIKTRLLHSKDQFRMVVLADWGFLRVKKDEYDALDDAFQKMLDTDEKIDGIYIGGDIAYDLDFYQGLYYEDFIKMLSQVGSRWPVVLNIGNHEHLSLNDEIILDKTFQIYGSLKTRLTVLNLPFVKWFMLDPYRIVFKEQNPSQLVIQFEEKLNQLKKTSPSKPIITCSHYPYRCNGNIPDCYEVRKKLNPFFLKMMEYNVALYIGAHYHTYERIYPYYRNNTFVKKQSPYTWVEGGAKNVVDNTLLSIVEGIAGNDRQIIAEYPPQQSFTAAKSIGITGFGIITLKADSITYDHVQNTNPYESKDHWVMLIQRKKQFIINQQNKNIRSQIDQS